MATASLPLPKPSPGSTEAAGLAFPDLFGVFDGAFDRFVKFKEYQSNSKVAQSAQRANEAILQLTEEKQATGTGIAGIDQQTLIVVGGIGLLALMLFLRK